MMYSNQMAFAIKVNGKVLREHGDVVYIPFGSEYTLLIKNVSSVRALVNVEIDGSNMTEGGSLIVNPNSSIELERSIKNGNLQQGNRFKFIERTEQIEEHRGIQVDDGLVRISYQFERIEREVYTAAVATDWSLVSLDSSVRSNSVLRNLNSTSSALPGTITCQAADVGITVPGSVSDQRFKVGSYFPVQDQQHVMVINLRGQTTQGDYVSAPITVAHKPPCPTCGSTNKATAKFCSQCGTSLIIV